MKRGFLSRYFTAVAAKRLSAVEADTESSNQHEFNGTKELKSVLGTDDRLKNPAVFLWFGGENEGISSEGFVSWYDARRAHPTRSEYRLYFQTSDVSLLAQENDMMFIAERPGGEVMIIITANGSTIESQLFWLFNLQKPTGNLFEFISFDDNDKELDFSARFILDELGIEIEDPESDWLDSLLEKFNGILPSTTEFSAFARTTLKGIDAIADPDAALVSWMDQEEKLFRRMERKLVSKRLETGFVSDGSTDVDGFISFSLGVQNRRKSRAGFALENHLEEIFIRNAVKYSRGRVTENKSKPDFLFPDIRLYHDTRFEAEKLTMLGAKTSCKDRWRQVLAEADRIKNKHLLTLEPGISESQTTEMQANNLQLILPKSLHSTYSARQQSWLVDVSAFINLVSKRQHGVSI